MELVVVVTIANDGQLATLCSRPIRVLDREEVIIVIAGAQLVQLTPHALRPLSTCMLLVTF